MATPQLNLEPQIDDSAKRLVWVLNKDANHSYKGTCEGIKVEIPKDREKIAKRFEKGGNLFPHVTARQFITDYKEPQEWVTDQAGKPQPIFRTKELFEQELTLSEYNEIIGKKPAEIKREAAQAEKKARKNLTDELKKVPNKISVEDED